MELCYRCKMMTKGSLSPRGIRVPICDTCASVEYRTGMWASQKALELESKDAVPKLCEHCDGDGHVPCSECGGTGEVKCIDCEGSGRED